MTSWLKYRCGGTDVGRKCLFRVSFRRDAYISQRLESEKFVTTKNGRFVATTKPSTLREQVLPVAGTGDAYSPALGDRLSVFGNQTLRTTGSVWFRQRRLGGKRGAGLALTEQIYHFAVFFVEKNLERCLVGYILRIWIGAVAEEQLCRLWTTFAI